MLGAILSFCEVLNVEESCRLDCVDFNVPEIGTSLIWLGVEVEAAWKVEVGRLLNCGGD